LLEGGEGSGGDEPALPERKGNLFKPGDNATHGLYAKVQPVEEVMAILAEGDQGVDEPIVGPRILARGLMLRLSEGRCSSSQAAQLSEAYLQAAGLLEELIRAEPQLAASSGIGDWTKEFIDRHNALAPEMGFDPITEDFLEQIRHSDPELAEASRHLTEEKASTRCVLRNAFRRAMETQDMEEYIRMVRVYCMGCRRLLRLLKTKAGDSDPIESYFRDALEQAY
jgi:hypothetical protein